MSGRLAVWQPRYFAPSLVIGTVIPGSAFAAARAEEVLITKSSGLRIYREVIEAFADSLPAPASAEEFEIFLNRDVMSLPGLTIPDREALASSTTAVIQ